MPKDEINSARDILVDFEVTVPDEVAGRVINDLQKRCADIQEMKVVPNSSYRTISGRMPLTSWLKL